MALFAEDILRLRAAEAAEGDRARQPAAPRLVVPMDPPGLRLPAAPVMPADGTDPRHALRAALAQRDAAAAKIAAARAAAQRGDGLLRDAETNLARVGQASEASTARWAERLRDWAASGLGEHPVAPPISGDRAAAETQLEAARLARDSLAGDVVAAEVAVAEAERSIEGAVIAILLIDAGEIARRMATAEQTAADLRESLSNLASVWLHRRAIPMPPVVVAALRDPPVNAPLPPRSLRLNDPALRAPWQDFAARLRENPEAQFED